VTSEDANAVGLEVPGLLGRRAPEIVVAVLAALTFLGFLGSMELWGKREQRAVAEAVDTVDRGHWLVAEIQSRPRLEKPPLPRWTTALLILATGQRGEWLMRLPAALSALAMVALVYGLGRRIGGRAVGLASALALVSLVYFVVEMRQAGNDGPLALFVTLAVYAAFRRLHGSPPGQPPAAPGEHLGAAYWSLVFFGALGLGFLTKGPIAILLAGLAVVPYAVAGGRSAAGLRALWSGWGLLLFLALALSWPVPVFLDDPKALQVWMLEMGQKAGSAGVTHHESRGLFLNQWPGLTAPWTIIATLGLFLPLSRPEGGRLRGLGLAWWWVVANLVMFCVWSVPKPNYFIPCLPGVALICGTTLVRLSQAARGQGRAARRCLRLLEAHGVAFVALALAAPLVVWRLWPSHLGWALAGCAILLAGTLASIGTWKRGLDFAALATLVGVLGALFLMGFGAIGPSFNRLNGHRAVAAQLESILPESQRVVMFYEELDEGLWYYLPGRTLRPVPGTQPRYNKGFDLLDDFRARRKILWKESERVAYETQRLKEWLENGPHESRYMLMKAKLYDLLRPGAAGLAVPVYREPDLRRNELVLLEIARRPDEILAIGASDRQPPVKE
jgi:4-amino-4-deoxy-L-arabinose transferase-like glycosyltransferase